MKSVINRFFLTSSLNVECEVFGAFRDLIPVNALQQVDEGLQRGRGRQGLLPDFRFELPSPQGEPTYRLAELKTIGVVCKWYPRSGPSARRSKGVERRSSRLADEYRRPLAALDERYHGTLQGQVGPLVRRLDSYGQLQGLVVGAFQEASKDVHSLLDVLADTKVKAMGLARGREGTDQFSCISCHWTMI